MMNKLNLEKGINRCIKCGYDWKITSKLDVVNCPSCRKPTPNKVKELRQIKNEVEGKL